MLPVGGYLIFYLVIIHSCAISIHVDVSDIKYVINFDFPNNTEDYIHRIGRTARADNVGTAYTFFTSQVHNVYSYLTVINCL